MLIIKTQPFSGIQSCKKSFHKRSRTQEIATVVVLNIACTLKIDYG